MAAILDMRKYPPHCPRPSTNSPIHPRADSTLQPAVAAAPPSPCSTIQRPSLTKLPLCLPACLPACPPPPRPFKVRADAFLRAGRLPSFSFHSNFLLFRTYIRCRTISSSSLFSENIFRRKSEKIIINSKIIDVSLADKMNVLLNKKISLSIASVEN